MWVAELGCALGHGFEGWFASREDFEGQRQRGLVSCPSCGSLQVERRISAPRLNLGSGAALAPRGRAAEGVQAVASAGRLGQAQGREAPGPVDPREGLRMLLAQLKAGSEDLGAGFADEARRIHRGEAPERAIRGQASAAQCQSLLDEGIGVLALPDPDALGPTH